ELPDENGSGRGAAVPVSTSSGVTTARLTWSGLSVSAGHTIKAVYNGDGNFATSNGTTAQEVDTALTTTTVTASPSPAVSGQNVTFTATVAVQTPGTTVNAYPAGTVQFYDGT